MAKIQRLEKIYARVDESGQPTKERTGVPTGDFEFVFKESDPVTPNRLKRSVFNVPGMTRELWNPLPTVIKFLIMHGIMQKCGDPAAGDTGDDVEEAVQSYVEQVIDEGNFYAEREKGESRPSKLAEAVWICKRALGLVTTGPDGVETVPTKDGGKETLAQLIARYSGPDGKDQRKQAMKNGKVRDELEKMRQAAHAAREAKLAKAPEVSAADL